MTLKTRHRVILSRLGRAQSIRSPVLVETEEGPVLKPHADGWKDR